MNGAPGHRPCQFALWNVTQGETVFTGPAALRRRTFRTKNIATQDAPGAVCRHSIREAGEVNPLFSTFDNANWQGLWPGTPFITSYSANRQAIANHVSTTLFLFRAVLFACFLALPAAAQDDDNVILRPPVKLTKGQTVLTVQQSRTSTIVHDSKTKQAMKDLSQSRWLDLQQIVRETDETGSATKVQLTVTAQLDLKATLPREDAFTQRVELKNVLVDLAFVDGAWRMDTESVRSRDMKSLSGPELHLLRRAVRDALQVHARPDLLLLPDQVAAGTKTIRPTLEQLARWSAAANESGRLVGQATDATFQLASRVANIATLAGRVQLLVPVEKESVKAAMEFRLMIDPVTGLLRQRDVTFEMTAPAGSAVTRSEGGGVERTTVTLHGRESASAPAGTFHALGWATEPDNDAPAWRDATLGLALTLPKDALQRPGLPAWDFPGGGSVSVEIRGRDVWPTLEQVLESGLDNLRSADLALRDLQPGEPFRLPDGLPAAIIHARSSDNKTAILVLLTADGPRTFAITAAAPTDNKPRLNQLEQTLRSLRVQATDAEK